MIDKRKVPSIRQWGERWSVGGLEALKLPCLIIFAVLPIPYGHYVSPYDEPSRPGHQINDYPLKSKRVRPDFNQNQTKHRHNHFRPRTGAVFADTFRCPG